MRRIRIISTRFSPVLNSRKHQLTNTSSYLYGDIPGATIDAITIEAHSNHTLQIYGKTQRLGVALPFQDQEPESSSTSHDFVKVNVEDASHPPSSTSNPPPPPPTGPNATTNPAPIQGQAPYFPPASFFGTTRLRTPFSRLALIPSSTTGDGNAKVR